MTPAAKLNLYIFFTSFFIKSKCWFISFPCHSRWWFKPSISVECIFLSRMWKKTYVQQQACTCASNRHKKSCELNGKTNRALGKKWRRLRKARSHFMKLNIGLNGNAHWMQWNVWITIKGWGVANFNLCLRIDRCCKW